MAQSDPRPPCRRYFNQSVGQGNILKRKTMYAVQMQMLPETSIVDPPLHQWLLGWWWLQCSIIGYGADCCPHHDNQWWCCACRELTYTENGVTGMNTPASVPPSQFASMCVTRGSCFNWPYGCHSPKHISAIYAQFPIFSQFKDPASTEEYLLICQKGTYYIDPVMGLYYTAFMVSGISPA